MLRLFRFFAVVGVLCFSGVLEAQPVATGTAPLPETYFPGLQTLLAAAVRQSPRMIARNTEEAIAEAERIMARAGQLPTVRAYGSYYPWVHETRGSEVDATTTQKTAYNMYAEQPVFHWGALRDATRIAELRKRIASNQTVEVYRALVAEIRAQYLQLIMKRLAVARARTGQKLADEALVLARQRVEQKVISEAELFGPTITAEQARLGADRLEDDLDGARIVLGKLCGAEPLRMTEIPDGIPPITPASDAIDSVVAEFTRQPETNSYGLQNLRTQIDIEKLNYAIARTRLRPHLNGVLGLTQDQQQYVYSAAQNRNELARVQSLYAGLAVNWSIFDGFATQAAKTASLARRRQLERDYGAQLDNVIRNVQAQKRQLDFAVRGLAIAEQYLALSSRTLREREEDHRRGLVSVADLAGARMQFLETQANTFAARNDYLLRVAEILSATLHDPALSLLPATLR